MTAQHAQHAAFGHAAGQVLECLTLAVEVHKRPVIDAMTRETTHRVGFTIGGGIDMDRLQAPVKYPDSGIYITSVEQGSAADEAKLKPHDKILQCNGYDMTMVTHAKAVKQIRKGAVLRLLIARSEMPTTLPN